MASTRDTKMYPVCDPWSGAMGPPFERTFKPNFMAGLPQIIKNPGRHAIVASDLSTQIHGELHTSQLGTFSGESVVGLCKLRKDFPYLLYSQS